MLRNRLIAILLVFVFILQLLPVRQAVRYFWVDNITVEEVIHVTKSLVKPPVVTGEDHLISEIYALDHPGLYLLLLQQPAEPETIIRQHATEVEIPPPNEHSS